MKNIRYLLAIAIVPLLLTACKNDNTSNDVPPDSYEFRTITFDSQNNILNLNYDNQGEHICVDDLGNEITFSTFSNYGIAVDVSGDFLYFTNSHENSTGLIRFSFNLENIHSYKISYPGEDFVSILPQITFDSSSGSKYVTSFEEVSEDSSIKNLVMDFNIEPHYGFYLSSIVITYLADSDTVEDVPHHLIFDHDHNHIPTTNGDFVCYDDKGREVTGYCAIDYNLKILNADGPFVFTQKEYGHVATYKINFNLTNIGKLYFDHEPNPLVPLTYFTVSSDTSGDRITDKTIIYEDKEHKSYGAALNFQLDGVSIVQDEFNGFEITYYPVD